MTRTMRSGAWSGWFVALAAWLALAAVALLRAAERPPLAAASAKPRPTHKVVRKTGFMRRAPPGCDRAR